MEIQKVLNTNYAAAAKWSSRSRTTGHFKKMKIKIRTFLERLSGNDLKAMLNDVFKHEDFDC